MIKQTIGPMRPVIRCQKHRKIQKTALTLSWIQSLKVLWQTHKNTDCQKHIPTEFTSENKQKTNPNSPDIGSSYRPRTSR